LNACSRLIEAGRTGFYFWRAQIYIRNGDHDRAIADLSEFIRLNPNVPKKVWALTDRGSAYEKKGELDKALADFREALNNGSTTASEDIKRIERKAQPPAPQRDGDETTCSQGNSPDALAACSRLIEANRLGFYFDRAQIYVKNGDYDRAIADLSEFIRLNPDSVRALNERGLNYERKDEVDKAIADYSKAIRLDKGSSPSYSYRGSAYEKKGELDKAIADYSEAIRLDKGSDLSYSYYNRGSAYEKKDELDKALADFREALNHGNTAASEDIERIEGAIESLRKKYVVNGLDGALGGRVSPQSNEYQKYQCTPSDQFEGVTWCNKQRLDEKEPRGPYRSSYTIAHSREGTIYYLNRSQEPAFFNAGEVDADIEHLSRKFGGEQPTRVRPHVRLGPNTDGIIAIWGKVRLEPLDAAGISELVAGRSPRKGILVDFIGSPTESARRGLDVYRVSGGPGFVWSGSFNSRGQGTMRFFAIDPWALLPIVSKERAQPAPPTSSANPQNDCDRLAANPSDRGKPPSVPGVPYDSLMNQAKQAIETCALAAQQNPAELRYKFQMARAMEAEDPEKAIEIHKKLAAQGYPAAYDNLGWLMVKLYKNYGAALTNFKTGSRLQDPDSMVSLVEMIDRGYVQTDRPYELKYQLLRTAADLGHQGAQLQIPEVEEKLSAAQRQAVQNPRIMMDFLGIR
jgi:tetratricopeptide (TPR) repeat protein